MLAEQFGVSMKTVRDIWNHKSWGKATKHLWEDDQTSDAVQYHLHQKGLLVPMEQGQGALGVLAAHNVDCLPESHHPEDPFHEDWPYW